MPPIKKTIFGSPQDVEAAFYEALSRGDLESMMAVWAEDEEIACIHPGSGRINGYAAIKESWAQIFGGGQRLNVQFTLQSRHQDPLTAVHSVIEDIALQTKPSEHSPIIATNIYVRGAMGWRMLVHHASPAPPETHSDANQTLH
ncbi:MAG TPA: nuclear transport factor 2 family protein [Rhodocyclaceae bacterium]|jgi:ketosteroid isomerase-like protein|nr:nuclear transport factor 2 family protein [Rhodocyclaceae bacterium]